jgi:hypothetical protein
VTLVGVLACTGPTPRADQPAADAEPTGATIEQIAAAISKHVAERTEAGGGYYRLMHDGRELKLQMVRVHMEYLADLGGGSQFACVDLAGADGPVYDVDFFLSGTPDNMVVSGTPAVHKVDGRPLYVWEQKEYDTWGRVPVKDAPPRLLGVVHDRDAFEFTYRVRIPAFSGAAQVWLPLASSDDFQTVEVIETRLPAKPLELRDRKYGNAVLHMSLVPRADGDTLEIVYRVRRREASPYPSVAEAAPEEFLSPERLVPDAAEFRTIAGEVTAGHSSELARARAIYDHVIERVRYARYGPGWGRGDAVYACEAGSGNCTDFHAYFISLARAAGIPARFAAGAAIPSERDDGGIDGYHCWAEFFARGEWWPVDVSEADKHPSLAGYYFGHLPANRLEFSRGRDLALEPGPRSGPINFLAYPILEVNGSPVEAKPEFRFRRLLQLPAGGSP